jgi:hypothetical protein
VPQPTAPRRAPNNITWYIFFIVVTMACTLTLGLRDFLLRDHIRIGEL